MSTIDDAENGSLGTIRLEPSGEQFPFAKGQTILSAALTAGIDLPYECASGGCGSCKGRLLTGTVSSLWPDATGLSVRDKSKGDRILCCQSVPETDCKIQIKKSDAVDFIRPEKRQGTVQQLKYLNPDVQLVTIQVRDPFDYKPGQFALITWSNDIGRRAYSMANLSDMSGRFDFVIKRKPGGAGSNQLFSNISIGDEVALEGPYGKAWLREPNASGLMLVAGGSGLAPMWAIAIGALKDNPQTKIDFYFGVNAESDLFWLEQIEEAENKYKNFTVNLILAKASESSRFQHGLVGDVFISNLKNSKTNADIYLAGPPGLMDSIVQAIVPTGLVDASKLYYDRFC